LETADHAFFAIPTNEHVLMSEARPVNDGFAVKKTHPRGRNGCLTRVSNKSRRDDAVPTFDFWNL